MCVCARVCLCDLLLLNEINPGNQFRVRQSRIPTLKSATAAFQERYTCTIPNPNTTLFLLPLVHFYSVAELWVICIHLNLISSIPLALRSCLLYYGFRAAMFLSPHFSLLLHAVRSRGFGLVRFWLFYSISTFLDYLMPTPSF